MNITRSIKWGKQFVSIDYEKWPFLGTLGGFPAQGLSLKGKGVYPFPILTTTTQADFPNIELIEWLTRCGLVPHVPALRETVDMISKAVDNKGICRLPVSEETFRRWGPYSGMQLEINWKSASRQECDITFRAALILHYTCLKCEPTHRLWHKKQLGIFNFPMNNIVMSEEHRHDHRYQVTILVGAEALGAKQEIIINDLSAHGFRASIKNKVKADDIVELELTVHPESKKQVIKMRGRVAYAKPSSYGQTFGAYIDSWGSDDQKAAYLDYILEISQEE